MTRQKTLRVMLPVTAVLAGAVMFALFALYMAPGQVQGQGDDTTGTQTPTPTPTPTETPPGIQLADDFADYPETVTVTNDHGTLTISNDPGLIPGPQPAQQQVQNDGELVKTPLTYGDIDVALGSLSFSWADGVKVDPNADAVFNVYRQHAIGPAGSTVDSNRRMVYSGVNTRFRDVDVVPLSEYHYEVEFAEEGQSPVKHYSATVLARPRPFVAGRGVAGGRQAGNQSQPPGTS